MSPGLKHASFEALFRGRGQEMMPPFATFPSSKSSTGRPGAAASNAPREAKVVNVAASSSPRWTRTIPPSARAATRVDAGDSLRDVAPGFAAVGTVAGPDSQAATIDDSASTDTRQRTVFCIEAPSFLR